MAVPKGIQWTNPGFGWVKKPSFVKRSGVGTFRRALASNNSGLTRKMRGSLRYDIGVLFTEREEPGGVYGVDLWRDEGVVVR